MQTSSPEQPKAKDPKIILLIGPHGSGKTTLVIQFPRLYLLDCDMNLDGPERHVRQQMKLNINYAFDVVPRDDAGKPVETHKCFDRICDKLDVLKQKHIQNFDWVCIDGLTLINEYVIQKILFEQRKPEMESRHWQPFKALLYKLLVSKVRSLGVNVIVCCHETSIERADDKKMMEKVLVERRPYIQGGINEQLGGLFTDVWRMEAKPAPANKVEFTLSTQRTTYDELKNSMGLEHTIKDPTYQKLEPYLKAL